VRVRSVGGRLKALIKRGIRAMKSPLAADAPQGALADAQVRQALVRVWKEGQRQFQQEQVDLSTPLPDITLLFTQLTKIPGMVGHGNPDELRLLFSLALACDEDGVIVEIGSWLGRSSAFLGLGSYLSSRCPVFCVDHFQGNPGKEDLFFGPLDVGLTMYEQFLANISRAGLTGLVTPLRGDSREIGRSFQGKITLLFIDACHEYEAVRADFEIWSAHVSPRGFVCFDDYHPSFPGVVRFIEGDLAVHPDYRIIGKIGNVVVSRKTA